MGTQLSRNEMIIERIVEYRTELRVLASKIRRAEDDGNDVLRLQLIQEKEGIDMRIDGLISGIKD